VDSESDPIFREVQRFHQFWVWLLIIALPLLLVGPFGYGMVKQLVLGQPWGDRPMSDTALAIVGTLSILFGIGMLALFLSAKLITEVRKDGLFVRFVPFHLSFHKIPLENLEQCEARHYRPIREYGGWGIRFAWKGKAYNVSGDLGVRLDYSTGRHLLIGSQRPEELAQAIASVLG